MANIISDETIEYVGILSKLELSDEEKEQAKKDMGSMLDYIDKLNELDTTGIEPMSHVFPVQNVSMPESYAPRHHSNDVDCSVLSAPSDQIPAGKQPSCPFPCISAASPDVG